MMAIQTYGLVLGCALIPLILEEPSSSGQTVDYSNEETVKNQLSGMSKDLRWEGSKAQDWLIGLMEEVFNQEKS